MEKGWLNIFTTAEDYQAEIARDLLESANIEAVVLNQKDSSYQVFGNLEVYVKEENEQAAIEILKDLKH
jgi:hypothetical protein